MGRGVHLWGGEYNCVVGSTIIGGTYTILHRIHYFYTTKLNNDSNPNFIVIFYNTTHLEMHV